MSPEELDRQTTEVLELIRTARFDLERARARTTSVMLLAFIEPVIDAVEDLEERVRYA